MTYVDTLQTVRYTYASSINTFLCLQVKELLKFLLKAILLLGNAPSLSRKEQLKTVNRMIFVMPSNVKSLIHPLDQNVVKLTKFLGEAFYS